MRQNLYMQQVDFRVYELNKRLQQRSLDNDNSWWESFCTEFFEDDAVLVLSFCLDDGPKCFTIGRTLIPRYFRSIFEGGVTELYFDLKNQKESFRNTSVTLDCDHALMVTIHDKPMFTKVLTEGRLVLEFTYDDMTRIRSWHFSIREHKELVTRSVMAMQQDALTLENLTKNITCQGITNSTLNFLQLCVILEPMQELMSRHKVYGLSPRECLKTTLFQKWQRMVAPPENAKRPCKKRKRKSATGVTSTTAMPPGGKQKRSPVMPDFNPLPGEVMSVGEPTLMGGEFGDEDERLIARLENIQYEVHSPGMMTDSVMSASKHASSPPLNQWNQERKTPSSEIKTE